MEIVWTTNTPVDAASTFAITRDGVLLSVAASTVSLFNDLTARPNVAYEYCVSIRSGATETLIGCDMGGRVIARPTGFEATDGLHENDVQLSWSDRSQIEAGFNLYRDAGNALTLDGTDDFVRTQGITDLSSSFTFEFWARRAATGKAGFIVNLETKPNGDPVDVDLEIGFTSNDRFQAGFGTNVLTSSVAYTDTDWHHWAVVYDAASGRRILYRDGEHIADDIAVMASPPTGDLEFGRRANTGSAANRGYFGGQIDEIRYWNTALTAEQVQARMGGLLSGNEANLLGNWPMDVSAGLTAPDLAGTHAATLVNVTGNPWVASGAPLRYRQIGANLTSYTDRSAVAGFQSYTYQVAAFEDVNGNGLYEAGTDFESERRSDTGWRASVTPPGNVTATDGQYNDRVRVTWVDQSTTENAYRVYRDGTLLATVGTDTEVYDDLTASSVHEYCVASVAGGVESIRICDEGRAGGLAAPSSVVASVRTFDDRVRVTWDDVSNTEDGFEVLRDGQRIATLGANVQEYNDLGALQDVAYDYCVRATSKADPLNPSYSSTTCADSAGVRAVILDPTGLAATDEEFEDRVELSWQSASTTAMLFLVYREGSLIEVLDHTRTMAVDRAIPSDTDLNYCVTAATVVAPPSLSKNTSSLQGQITQVLETMAQEEAARLALDGLPTTPEAKLEAVYQVLGFESAAALAAADTSGYYESNPICATGRRSILPPTAVEATDNEHENHVQVSWTDNSSVEQGYLLYRTQGNGAPVLLDTLSANRTTYGDYGGIPGVEAHYTIQAFDAYDTSQTASDNGKRTLKPPTNFTASDGTSESVVLLSWRDNSSAELGYRIYRSVGSGAFAPIAETGKNEPGYVDLVPDSLLGITLHYKVAAFDAYGESVQSSEDGGTRLDAPANVNASDTYDGHIKVVWVDVSQVEGGYILTRRPVGLNAVDLTDSLLAANTTLYTDTSPAAGRSYEYCVQARLGSGATRVLSEPVCDIGVSSPGGVVPPVTPGLRAQRITPTYALSFGDGRARFGESVALSGSTALVGAPGADDLLDGNQLDLFNGSSTGWVGRYLFQAGGNWNETPVQFWGAEKTQDAGESQEEYGHAVAISGDFAIVGDPFNNDASQGAFEGWKAGANPADDWTDEVFVREAILSAGGRDNAGFAVALTDSFAVVGDDVFSDGPLPDGHGGAFICNLAAAMRGDIDCKRSTGVPRLEDVLAASKQVKDAAFGSSVGMARAADTLYAIVGAPGNDLAYIFSCNVAATACDSTTHWVLAKELSTRFRPNNRFGAAVAISGRVAVVGAPGTGAVMFYERTEGTWEEKAPYRPQSDAEEFGAAVSLSDTTIVVGAPGEDIGDYEDAGALYTMRWDPVLGEPSAEVRYDARVAGKLLQDARFGASVAVSNDVQYYLVGAPQDNGGVAYFSRYGGAAYLIPFGLEPPSGLIVPPGVVLAEAGNIRASDGTAPDRIQVRWDDESEGEDGHFIYRSDETGEPELIAEVAADIEFFDDFEAAPGEAYTYCVSAYLGKSETERRCDVGWRPPNGTIAGRLASPQGGGTEDAQVCLTPSPNRALIFDGYGGFVSAVVGEELDLFNDFTLEAWIRPNATGGLHYVAAKDSAYALAFNDGKLRLTLFRTNGSDETFEAALLPAMTPGTWYHVAASMDRDRNVTLYQDGVAEAIGAAASLGNVSGDTLTIGQRGDGSGFFEGEIDEVRIWDGARDSSQIAATRFDLLKGNEENLVGYWGLDQGLRRIVPDLTKSANHGELIDGVYLADTGAPIKACAATSNEGNFSISRIRYGGSTEFTVTPSRPGRRFEPSFKQITLTVESPVQNEALFTDATAFTVGGTVQYVDVVGPDTLTCPVAEVRIHAAKGDVPTNENVRITTGADGTFLMALDPSMSPSDTWFIMPTFTADGGQEHVFTPTNAELVLLADTFGVAFADQQRATLSGFFSGGDPQECHRDIGEATIRVRTQDGCYDRTFTVDSGQDNGAFTLDLPPQLYLMEVVSVTGTAQELADEVQAFFKQLGAVEVDLTGGDVVRNLTYRAPLTLAVEGLSPGSCPSNQIVQKDEEGSTLRLLPNVPRIGESEFVGLTIRVEENYGNGEVCAVNEGTITIFDAIADRVDTDSTMQIVDGMVQYTTFGASPNIFSGARIAGVDRSFQKPITIVAQVEGREPLMTTQWAIVEGYRERASTFVSATTDEFPLLIVHDPPGSNSTANFEKGTSYCTTLSNMKLLGGGAGVDIDLKFGFASALITAPLGIGIGIETGGGFAIGGRVVAGQDVTQLQDGKPNRTVCVTTTEAYATSDDPGWVGEDIFVGVALNLVFAIADVLEFDDAGGQCSINLSETLASDIDQADPFETTYAYGGWHISQTLIPELEHLIELAGNASVNGTVDGKATSVRLQSAVDNWKAQLANNESLKAQALADPLINRSFSGGTTFSYSEATDTSEVTSFESKRIYINADGHVGGVLNLFKFEQNLYAVFEVRSEWVSEKQTTEGETQTIGYVLKDEDAGDYFSVDIAKDPRYGTFVFGTRSGRSSNTCEANTQCRDNPIITVDPPIRYNVSPGDAASFEVTLINGSESNERRRYMLAMPAETNRNNLSVNVGGGLLNGPRQYLLDPGKAITVKMDAYASPSAFSYDRVGLMLYPPDEYPIWAGEMRLPFALSDTAFFSVHFDSTGGNMLAAQMTEGWNWFSINRAGGDVATVLQHLPARHGDVLRGQHAESRYDSTAGWTGTLTRLDPSEGYRLRLQEPTLFRILGRPLEAREPQDVAAGWSWIGYLPSKRMPIGDAMASLADRLTDGDAVVGQRSFAQYMKGVGWIGTLQEMMQGESYALYVGQGGKLRYPETPDEVAPSAPEVRETTVLGPQWTAPAEAYDAAMTVVAEVEMDGTPLPYTTLKIGVFDGDNIRGTGEVHYVEALDKYLAFILVYGTVDEEKPLVVHVFDGEADKLFERVATVGYEAQRRLGQPASPVKIDLKNAGLAPELLELPTEVALHPNYPNPFNGATTIAYDLPQAADVKLVVYDLLGRRVAILVDGEQPAGYHKLAFDGRVLASGVYMYRMEVGGDAFVGKMVLVK